MVETGGVPSSRMQNDDDKEDEEDEEEEDEDEEEEEDEEEGGGRDRVGAICSMSTGSEHRSRNSHSPSSYWMRCLAAEGINSKVTG